MSVFIGSISPNNEKMVLVSDQGVAYLYQITENGYNLISEYKGKTRYSTFFRLINFNIYISIYIVSDEPSLSCAWNQSSEIFAVACQDGYVHVYDSVTEQKLCQLGSLEVNSR
jgi:WD40 repeat protein